MRRSKQLSDVVDTACLNSLYQRQYIRYRFGWFSDGVAVLWKKDKFGLAKVDKGNDIPYSDMGIVHVVHAVVTLNPSRWTGVPISVVTCHLKAKSPNEEKRALQMEVRRPLSRRFFAPRSSNSSNSSLLQALMSKVAPLRSTSAVIFAGDFNTDPVDTPDNKSIVIPWLLSNHPWLKSAYPLDSVQIDHSDTDTTKWLWTTWKKRRSRGEGGGAGELTEVSEGQAQTREGGWGFRLLTFIFLTPCSVPCPPQVKHAIDYIFHSSERFRCSSILRPPGEEVVLPHRLPCWRYPSDHISICADLEVVL